MQWLANILVFQIEDFCADVSHLTSVSFRLDPALLSPPNPNFDGPALEVRNGGAGGAAGGGAGPVLGAAVRHLGQPHLVGQDAV